MAPCHYFINVHLYLDGQLIPISSPLGMATPAQNIATTKTSHVSTFYMIISISESKRLLSLIYYILNFDSDTLSTLLTHSSYFIIIHYCFALPVMPITMTKHFHVSCDSLINFYLKTPHDTFRSNEYFNQTHL